MTPRWRAFEPQISQYRPTNRFCLLVVLVLNTRCACQVDMKFENESRGSHLEFGQKAFKQRR